MFLFSGTFFPISSLPARSRSLAWLTPLWHGVTLCRDLTLGDVSLGRPGAPRVPARVRDGRAPARADDVPQTAGRLMSELVARARLTAPARPVLGGLLIIERNVMVYRRTWMILFSGFFEPLFYLFFFVYPLQEFIGDVTFEGRRSSTRRSSPLRSRIVGDERRVLRRDERVLEAPLRQGVRLDPRDPDRAEGRRGGGDDLGGRPGDALLGRVPARIVALGLVESPWALLALPACFVIGFGFAGAGIAAVTWMRTWKDFDLIQLIMLPMFMFSATFYPDLRLPRGARVDRPLPPAVPRDRARPLAHDRDGRTVPARQRRLSPGDGLRRPFSRHAASTRCS